MAGIPFEGLLQEFEGKGKLIVVISYPRAQPGNEPIPWGQQQRFLEAIICARFPAGEQYIASRQPDIRSVAPLLDRCVGESQRRLQVPSAPESDPFGREQFRLLRKALQSFVRP